MKKLLMLCAVIASMGASCFQAIEPPTVGDAFGRYCPPDRTCRDFPAIDHTRDDRATSSQ